MFQTLKCGAAEVRAEEAAWPEMFDYWQVHAGACLRELG